MTTTRPLRRDAQRNRERILGAARQVFAGRGIDATLDDVAAAAGVGVGTVYRRYPNKDALLDELFEQRIADLAEMAEGSLSHEDPWAAFTGFLERMAEGFAGDRALEYLVLHSDRGRERTARARDRLQAPVAGLVARAKASGQLRADFEPDDLRMIHTMVAAVAHETPEGWRRCLALLVEGLRPGTAH
jgi:AcrR family transcriptional regulator